MLKRKNSDLLKKKLKCIKPLGVQVKKSPKPVTKTPATL